MADNVVGYRKAANEGNDDAISALKRLDVTK